MKKQTSSQNTIPGVFLETAKQFFEKPALVYKKDHCFEYIPYKRLLNLVQNLTFSLEKIGIRESDRVILISENRPEWIVTDISVGSLGAILVPVNKAGSAKQLEFIVSETEPSLFIISDSQSFAKLSETIDKKHEERYSYSLSKRHIERDYKRFS